MDVEQAMLYANRTASQVRDPQALEVVRTLAAEVRRLREVLASYQIEAARERGGT